jgi:peptidoglycan lytic transglycosylase
MKALTAATAALCLFAHSTAAFATDDSSNGALAQTKKQKLTHHAKSHPRAAHNKSHKRTLHAKVRRATMRRVASAATRGAHDFSGIASFYWEGQRVATGARYNPDGLTCAHRTLPFGTRLQVTDLVSKRSVVVTVNDRGPFVAGRVLDLSRGAATVLGMTARGVTPVRATVM